MQASFSSGDFPANPIEKAGYQLEFSDEFEQPRLDLEKWLPFYLPHWSKRLLSAPDYHLQDSNLVLKITQNQLPWCPEFDGEVKCSSVQTGEFAGPLGSPIGQHRFNPRCTVRQAQSTLRTYTPQYGYFELRARAVRSAANHAALWMIGFEDAPERSGEIDIFEIMGAGIQASSSEVGFGVRRWSDPRLVDEFTQQQVPIDASQYHIYALEWFPTHLVFSIDNQEIKTLRQSPNYPMQFMLSLYEIPSRVEAGAVYPKEFAIDYFRAYQPVGGYGG